MLVFPSDKIAFESAKTMQHEVVSYRSGRGRRKSMTNRAYPVYEIRISLAGITQEEMEVLAGFFAAVKGAPFLFRDFEDYAQYGVTVGAGDGKQTDFQLIRNLGGLFYEPIQDIVPGSLIVYLDDARAEAALLEGGVIRFNPPPLPGVLIRADFEYYWRVALDGGVEWSAVFYDIYRLNGIKLVTV